MLQGKTILITGGTGSFGKRCCHELLKLGTPAKIIILSRDELKQYDMATNPAFSGSNIRYFIGDVRDKDRLNRAMTDVDYVIHAGRAGWLWSGECRPSFVWRLLSIAPSRAVGRVS